MAVTAENVLQALDVLLNNPDNNAKQQASTFLEHAQKTQDAWTVMDTILRSDANEQASLFAAQSMRQKIKFSFFELPEEFHMSLRDSLLSHIDRFSGSTQTAVLTQLIVALVDLMAYVVAWTDPLRDLLGYFGHRTDKLKTLLEILEVFPQETESRALRISDKRLYALDDQLRSHGNEILTLLQTCLSTPEYQERTNKCLGSCARIHVFTDDMLKNAPILLTAPFEALRVPRLFDSAVDAICGLLQMSYNPNRYPNTINAMIQQVMALQPAYAEALKQTEKGSDTSFGLARIFCTLCECYIDMILESPDGVSVVNMIVECTANPETRTSEMTFDFWHDVLDRLAVDHERTSRRTSGPERDEQYTGPLRDSFQALIHCLLKHIMYPEESEPDELMDNEDDHAHFRKSASMLVKRTADLLGPMSVLCQLVKLVSPLLNNGLAAVTQPGDEGKMAWRQLESFLYLASGVVERVSPSEDLVIPDLLSVVSSYLSCTQTKGNGENIIPSPIRNASLMVLGSLARWFNRHNTYVTGVVSLICSQLQILPSVAPAAVHAFTRISRTCSPLVVPSLDQIIATVMQNIDNAEPLRSLDREYTNELYCACGLLLSEVQPTTGCSQRLALLIQPVVSAIDIVLPKIVFVPSTNSSSTISTPTGFLLDRMTFVFKELKNVNFDDTVVGIAGQRSLHPCRQIALQLWPKLEQIYNIYQAHEPTLEKWTRCLKAIITCLGANSSLDLLQPLVTCLVSGYTRHMHSPLAYLAVQVVRLYGAIPECREGLSQMLTAFVTPTLAVLTGGETSSGQLTGASNSSQSDDPYSTHPDVVEDFFRLMLEYLSTMPVFFLSSAVASPVFLCAINGLHGYHDDGLNTTAYFLRDVLARPVSSKNLSERAEIIGPIHAIVREHGQELCAAIVSAIGGGVPLRSLERVAMVLYDLRCVCSGSDQEGRGENGVSKEDLNRWLETSLAAVPRRLVSDEDKKTFLVKVFSSQDAHALDEATYRFAQRFEGENKIIA
eukprot:CFRG2392T1